MLTGPYPVYLKFISWDSFLTGTESKWSRSSGNAFPHSRGCGDVQGVKNTTLPICGGHCKMMSTSESKARIDPLESIWVPLTERWNGKMAGAYTGSFWTCVCICRQCGLLVL